MTDREEELIEAAREGRQLVCKQDLIRADLIRELLLGKHGDLDPRGIRVVRAHITGQLDLEYVKAKVGLRLVGCTFDAVWCSPSTPPRSVASSTCEERTSNPVRAVPP